MSQDENPLVRRFEEKYTSCNEMASDICLWQAGTQFIVFSSRGLQLDRQIAVLLVMKAIFL
jgi:hypothetical protein